MVVSITQLQQRDTLLRSLVERRNRNQLPRALRSRNFVNGTLSLLERYRDQYQVLELDPSLLRYMRPAGRGTVDPDEGDVLEDRLLVEGVHAVFKATRTRAEQRVVTSDLLLTRVLRAEGIPTLFLRTPRLGEETIPCLHYSPIAKGFCGAPLSALLWDLAHSFSAVRVTREETTHIQLETYWPDKGAGDWQDEILSFEVAEAAPAQTGGQRSARGSDRGRRARSARSGAAAAAQPRTRTAAGRLSSGVLSNSGLPQPSLPQILRLGGAVSLGPGSIADVLARIPSRGRPTVETATRCLEILRRAGMISFDGTTLSLSPKWMTNLDRLTLHCERAI